MPFLRNPKTNRFLQVDNAVLETSSISWRAKGLLCYLLSRPDSWEINLSDLQNRSPKEGRDAVRSALNELQEFGFLVKKPIRGDHGKMNGWEYWVSESPRWDEPKSDEPKSANPTYSNTDSESNTNPKEEETRIPELSLSNAVTGEEVSIPTEAPKEQIPTLTTPLGEQREPKEERHPSAMFQNETIHQDARGLTGKARALRDDLNEAEASAWAASLVLGVPMPSFRPARHQFDAFVDEYCPKIEKHRPELFGELCEKDWKDGRGRPIGNWKSYVLGLEEKMPF